MCKRERVRQRRRVSDSVEEKEKEYARKESERVRMSVVKRR